MPFNVIEHSDDGVLEFSAYGELAYDEAEQARALALELTQEKGFRLIFGDGSQLISLLHGKTLELFQFGVNLAKMIFPLGTQFAVALPLDNPAKQDAEFLITVAINRGMHIASFSDRDMAWKHLSKS